MTITNFRNKGVFFWSYLQNSLELYLLKAKTRRHGLEKNYCSGDRQQKDLSRFKVAIHKFMPLILVLIASIQIPFATIYAQPTGNLEAKYYSTHNRYSSFDTFGGTVIETRTWEKINTVNYNPQGRRDYWSVDIQGFIYIPIDLSLIHISEPTRPY